MAAANRGPSESNQRAGSTNERQGTESVLGMLIYYGNFLRNLSTMLELHRLLRNTLRWQWGRKQRKAVEQAKESLKLAQILMHYDSNKPLILACDASP